ncbi:AEC family transporter [Limisalsivibrio acetivorans]|uniref:AEC family transporter n=1 Tax=Limisalsivibrio acetivorans TaxID=1304888 RepID=UPI0003B34863|nr:AEC family transporter [Limisalsivibrio acetivorans]
MIKIILIVLPIFIVLLVGSFLRRGGLIDEQFIKTSNRLIFNVCLPVLLFYKISQADIGSVLDWRTISIIVVSILLMFILSFISGKALGFDKKVLGTFAMNNFRANYAYMGLPVSFYAYGDQGLMYASVLMAIIVPYVNFMSVIALSISSPGGEKRSFVPFIKNTLLNPLAIACVAGLVVAALNIGIPDFINRTLDIISGVTLPLALFCVGASISFAALKGDIAPTGASLVMKLIGLPLIAFIILKIWGIDLDVGTKTMVIMLAAPSATVNYVLAATMDGSPSAASSTIVATTTFSIFTFVFWLNLLGL